MKKQIILCAAFFIFAVQAVTAEAALKIGYFDSPPNITFKEGKHQGALVDYWEKLLVPEMGVEIEWVGPLPPLRLFKWMDEGVIDCIALLSKTPDREKKWDFPAAPFRKINAGLAILKAKKIDRIESIDYLRGITIGFFEKGFIPPVLRQMNLNWDYGLSIKWKKHALDKLMRNRIDGVFEPDRTALDYELAIDPVYKENVVVLDIPQTETLSYSAFSKKDHGKYLNLYNRANGIVLEKDNNAYMRLVSAHLK